MEAQVQPIFLFGASGHAKVIIDIIECGGGHIAFLADDDFSKHGEIMCEVTVRGGRDFLMSSDVKSSPITGIVSIGNNRIRANVAVWLKENDFSFATAIHSAASVSRFSRVGEGTVVMAGAVVNPAVTIGMHCIINTRCSIDHDCTIGDCVHVAPGATICGGVSVGSGTFIGAGATVIPNVFIGNNVIIGAGTTVVSNIPNNVLAVGTPAKVVKRL